MRGDEDQKGPVYEGSPGKTPGKSEGGDDPRSRPYPNEPGKTPGSAEGPDVSTDEAAAERSPDPNRLS